MSVTGNAPAFQAGDAGSSPAGRSKKYGTHWEKRWDEQDGKCFYCGEPMSRQRWQTPPWDRTPDPNGWTVDHLLPTAEGGKNAWDNKVLCHQPCNQEKGSRLPTWAEVRRFEDVIGKIAHLVRSQLTAIHRRRA